LSGSFAGVLARLFAGAALASGRQGAGCGMAARLGIFVRHPDAHNVYRASKYHQKRPASRLFFLEQGCDIVTRRQTNGAQENQEETVP
jgi:hypothetical protein